MSHQTPQAEIFTGFPRYFKIGCRLVSSYKVFLCAGIYTGTLASAAVAQSSGISPLGMGLGCVSSAIVGIFGARIFYLAFSSRPRPNGRFWSEIWNPKRGGGAIFGSFLAMAPFSLLPAAWLDISLAVYWDHMIFGIVTASALGRFGCILNGCCIGKRTINWYGTLQHDTQGANERRIPVQWLEIGWWLLAGMGLLALWHRSLPAGSYVLGVVLWYGLGRLWLEALREESVYVAGGRVRINQATAAILALTAGGGLVFILYSS